jgi:hypothetical protein
MDPCALETRKNCTIKFDGTAKRVFISKEVSLDGFTINGGDKV